MTKSKIAAFDRYTAAAPDNKVPATEECRWCSAIDAPHLPSCPLGERYRYFQNRQEAKQ